MSQYHTLYVGGLSPEVTEMELQSLIASVVPVTNFNLKIPTDHATKQSRCYAYVNFSSRDEAERVRRDLNYSEIKGRVIRIMNKNSDPSMRRSGIANVFVRPLAPHVTHKTLHNFFEQRVGEVQCVRVTARDTPKRFGFVQFTTKESAQRAIRELADVEFEGHKLQMQDYKTRAVRQRSMQFTNVYVKGFPASWDLPRLRELFSSIGETTSCHLATVEMGGVPRPFGFVNFGSHEQAKAAIERLHMKPVPGIEMVDGSEAPVLYVQRAMSKTERLRQKEREARDRRSRLYEQSKGRNLFVKPLAEEVTDEELERAFSAHGEVESARVMRNEAGVSRGFGFVQFKTVEEATRATTALNGTVLQDRKLIVAQHQLKVDRERQLRAAFAERTRKQMRQPGGGAAMNAQAMFMQMIRNNPMLMQQMMVMQQRMAMGGPGGPPPGPAGAGGAPMMPAPVNPMQAQQQAQQQAMMQAQFAQQQQQQQAMMRAQVAQQQQQQAAVAMMPPAVAPGQQEIDTRRLAAMTVEERVNFLGEQLYPRVAGIVGEMLAGKITGMLLELESTEVLDLLTDESALRERVSDAQGVLQDQAQ